MTRTDRAERLVRADPAAVFAALVGREALERWLPPAGMSGRFEHFDARPGGSYRLVLTYDDAGDGRGKTTSDADVSDVRFVDIRPDSLLVQAVDFVSDDPAFSGTMTLTWEVRAAGGCTRVAVRAEDVPPGISSEDHATGMASSLQNLAAYVEAQTA